MADQGWILLIILAGAIWVWYFARKKGAAASQSKPALEYEARDWIRNHPHARINNRSPLAWHARFMSAESALQFIDSLYKAGAIDVQIDRGSLNSSWDPTLGRYIHRPDAGANSQFGRANGKSSQIPQRAFSQRTTTRPERQSHRARLAPLIH
jgi:hypothetical protein